MNFLPGVAARRGAGRACRHPAAWVRWSALKPGCPARVRGAAEPGRAGALPATVTQVQDIGTYWLVTARRGRQHR
jgi:glycerol transport system ATP-binding protein